MTHFFQHCLHCPNFCMGLMEKVNQIDENFSYLSDDEKLSLLVHGYSRFDDNKNNFISLSSTTIF